jgi:ATP-dependent Clp endopeptidase proteolytic subunit ClpP
MIRYLNVDQRIKTKPADLLESPVVIRVNKFNEEAVEKFNEGMAKAHETGQEVIPIIVDSYGGQVYSLLSMISEIQNAKVPVATIVESKAMSAGAILFSFGTEGYRYCAPNATLMIHEVSSFSFGKVEDLKVDAEETDRLNTLIFKLMGKNCGKGDNYFLDLIHEKGHTDWYLTAKEAKKHNLANHLRVPEYRVDVKVETFFG